MSRLSDLLRQVEQQDPQLASDLAREVRALSQRRPFGLNFERHIPETVELYGRPVRKGDKVRFLAPRGESPKSVDRTLCKVVGIGRHDGERVAKLVPAEPNGSAPEPVKRAVADLVVVAEFRDPIYPGLVSTGKVERGGDKPFHTVVNAENFHALQLLLYTHEGKVDAIYIDPPYNTGARDWKYNNDYIDADDAYRHSKWLAFMERRLKLARRLLNPDDSMLVVTIDENELSHLNLLLGQTFPGAGIQLVTSVINRAGSPRPSRLTRVEEYLLFVFLGEAAASPWTSNLSSDQAQAETSEMPTVWFSAIRVGSRKALRSYYADTTLFYPVLIDGETGAFHSVGPPLPTGQRPDDYEPPAGTIPIWPVSQDREQTWRFSREKMTEAFEAGTARLGRRDPATGVRPVTYLRPGTVQAIEDGVFRATGRSPEGALELELAETSTQLKPAATVWNRTSHYARDHGSKLLARLVPGQEFPFPKSLYAVEDTIRIAVGDKPDAVVLDFFAGSGTTAHAVLRLNRQDGGRRQCVSVTNNEVSADEQKALREEGLRPGDADWEAMGICERVTKPRLRAAVTGKTPEGEPIKGDYKFVDEFPMAEGIEENIEFFTMTYEAPRAVAHHRSFEAIAPLLWLKAGSRGSRIDKPTDDFVLADTYAILFDTDCSGDFLTALHGAEGVGTVFIITDDDRAFQMVCVELPAGVESVRLYSSYLTNFAINTGRD